MIAHKKIKINKDTVYLIEALKVEGYWSSKNFTLIIQNKNIPLLNHIEAIVRNLEFEVKKRMLLKIRLKDKTKKEDIEILSGKDKINFHIEKSPFDNDKVKAVTNLPYKKNYRLIIKENGKENLISIKYEKDRIISKSNLECWVYGDLRFPVKQILNFLDKYSKKEKMHLGNYLNKDNLEFIASAFSALIDCEGSINCYKLKRIIRVRMRDKEYLEEWSKLLNKLGIGCKFRKNSDKEYEINISGWEDFNRLSEIGVKFYNSKKNKGWKEMMFGFKRNQISRNSYKKFYIAKLKELNKKVTAQELANYIKKSKRVINHYLLKLERENLILCNKKIKPYLYFISNSSVR